MRDALAVWKSTQKVVCATCVLLLATGSVFAAGIDIGGTFARGGSCGVPSGDYPNSDDWSLLTETEFQSHEGSCSIPWMHKAKDDPAWSAIFFCSSEGDYESHLVTIRRFDDTVWISGYREDEERLEICE